MDDRLLGLVLACLARRQRRAILVTAPVGGGKTTAVMALAEALGQRGRAVGGVVAPRMTDDDVTIGYDVCDLATGQRAALARRQLPGTPVGRYYLRPDGLALADQAIRQGLAQAEVVIVDEVGRAELAGQGHFSALHALLRSPALPVLTVRSTLLEPVQTAFELQTALVHVVLPARRKSPKRQGLHPPHSPAEQGGP